MARTALVVQQPRAQNGILNLESVEVAGDVVADAGFANDEQTLLMVRNAGVGAHILTFDTPGTVEGNAIANPVTGACPAGKWSVFGPFPRSAYNQDDGMVYWASDGTKTECKYVALRLAHA